MGTLRLGINLQSETQLNSNTWWYERCDIQGGKLESKAEKTKTQDKKKEMKEKSHVQLMKLQWYILRLSPHQALSLTTPLAVVGFDHRPNAVSILHAPPR